MSGYYPSLSAQLAEAAESWRGKRVCVIGHARPDGDCIGSQVALTRLLRTQGVDAFAANADIVPVGLSYLVESTVVEDAGKTDFNGVPLVYVDCADEQRVGPMTSRRLEANERWANIDHHISNTGFAGINLVDSASAATCEILAGLAFDLDWPVDEATAQALYAGILTDTGRFSYAATTSRVFELAARLVDCGALPERASRNLYDTHSFARLMLLRRFLGSLEIVCGGRVCVGVLAQTDYLETGANYEDSEGFVDFARATDDVLVGVLIEQRKTMTKGSLRGRAAPLRLDQVAALFGGGGHARAAGLSTDLPASILKERLIAALEQNLDNLSI